jgi:glycosyltransferase involved in cell wall biosynthesis
MLANSKHIQAEIKKYYNRDAEVVYPPVDTERFKSRDNAERFSFVIAARQTPYKRVDLAVAACSQINAPLKVIGNGPEYHNLTAMAGPSVRFMGFLPADEVARHLQISEAFIFPGLDDFGIVPIEAMAAGTPVIAYKAGGALDYVTPGVTGEFFEDQTVASLAAVLKTFKQDKYDHKIIAKKAEMFSNKKFHDKMVTVITKYTKRAGQAKKTDTATKT